MSSSSLHTPLFDLENVFQVDDYLYFYSESLTDERSDAETAALVKLLELDQPCDILDLACGFGRHANRLAAMGHRLTGVDYMPGFLERARADATRRGVQVNYRQEDMRRIKFQSAFDRVTLLFTAFGYFKDAENLLVLENVARALRPGGLFLTDGMNRDAVSSPNFLPYIVTEKGADLMIDRNSFDSQTGLLYNQRIVIRDGVRRDVPFAIRIYNPSEMRQVLVNAGLEVVGIYGNWEGEPASSASQRLVMLARKP